MTAKRSRASIWLGVAFVVIVLFAASPLIAAFAAGAIADILGCTVNEGGASMCMFMGRNIGQTLAELFVLGWLSFVTLPAGLFALAIWLVVACVVAFIRSRRRRREA
jgi:hypothetical protein